MKMTIQLWYGTALWAGFLLRSSFAFWGFSTLPMKLKQSSGDHQYQQHNAVAVEFDRKVSLNQALGDFSVTLEKPLGMILEENQEGVSAGVYVKELLAEGSAASTNIVPGDVLLQVQDKDVSTLDFDSIMSLLVEAPSPVDLTLGDGLGMLDMPKNVVKQLKTTEDAYFIDAVVRQAVRQIRKDGRLGILKKVEVVVGAGVQENGLKGLARFFAILSTDGVTSYS